MTPRDQMVEFQLARRGIADERVLAAMRQVPREAFVPDRLAKAAYEDGPLPIGSGQTISQPYIVARMLEAALTRPGERLLDVGTGSGYAAAVASAMGLETFSIERHRSLGETAAERLARLGYKVDVRIGDGSLGLPDAAPFDAIVAGAGSPEVPPALREQLAMNGRLVIPVGRAEDGQKLLRVIRRGDDEFEEEELTLVRFVPLIGEGGWRDAGSAAPDGTDAASDRGRG